MPEAPAAIVCGMGGSAIGGDLAAAALGDRLTKPLLTVRGYELPSWAPAGAAVLCSSYSGDTEETLACYAAAEALGADRVVATTGGQLADSAARRRRPGGRPALRACQPRAAVGYMFCVATELAALAEAAPRIRTEIDAAAAHLESRSRRRSRPARPRSPTAIGDAVPVFYGAGLTSPVAYRWKTQVNENAQAPGLLLAPARGEPQRDRRLGGLASERPRAASCSRTPTSTRASGERFEVTAELIEPHAARASIRVEAEGETRTARLLELVMLGDLVSLAPRRAPRVDPSPIEAIDALKAKLGWP